jgi:lipopolysaccharide transport system permease protein
VTSLSRQPAIIRQIGNRTVVDDARAYENVLHSIWCWLKDMWHYRDLLRNMVARDLKVRYKNSVLGVLWSLFNPLLMMAVFTVVFTIMTPSGGGIPHFPAFVLCALLPWNFFSSAVIGATSSVVRNADLVKKVYFPREILPISSVLAEMINFVLALVILFGMVLVSGIALTPWALLLPVVIIIHAVFTLGVGLILATLNVFYRDTQQILSVVMLAWFFVTPIFYPVSILPHSYSLWGLNIDVWRWAHILNPMTSLTATYRVILYNGAPPAFDFVSRTAITAMVFLLIGIYVFRRYSWRFAEEV